jgi:putative Mg2+ transporter-C (MgtC) family protein
MTEVLDVWDIGLRLVAAVVAGAALGADRDIERKPIGARTLALVSLGAASLTVAALEIPGLYENKDALSRVVQGLIQGVMAGIGFVGAGVIVRRPELNLVRGLTTAATVWVAAVLGLVSGLGQWLVLVVTTILALVVLIVLKRILENRKIYSD